MFHSPAFIDRCSASPSRPCFRRDGYSLQKQILTHGSPPLQQNREGIEQFPYFVGS